MDKEGRGPFTIAEEVHVPGVALPVVRYRLADRMKPKGYEVLTDPKTGKVLARLPVYE